MKTTKVLFFLSFILSFFIMSCGSGQFLDNSKKLVQYKGIVTARTSEYIEINCYSITTTDISNLMTEAVMAVSAQKKLCKVVDQIKEERSASYSTNNKGLYYSMKTETFPNGKKYKFYDNDGGTKYDYKVGDEAQIDRYE